MEQNSNVELYINENNKMIFNTQEVCMTLHNGNQTLNLKPTNSIYIFCARLCEHCCFKHC
jgi:hypothetical protein